jgi:cysteine desulfurase
MVGAKTRDETRRTTTEAVETEPIYLDHNATTPVLEEVVLAMLPWLRSGFGNPSSGHAYGRRARAAVEAARAEVAALLGAEPDEIVFTSGGTEASNLAIRGAALARPALRHVVTSVVEHPATVEPCRALGAEGYDVAWLLVDESGRVRPSDAGRALRDETLLVTVMHAQNETGVLMPIAEIARAAHARRPDVLVHTDAAQSVGKVPVDVDTLGVDLLTLAGHKLYAPKGVGALYVRRGTHLAPFVRGAGHERGLRPGTENVASIVGLGVACTRAARDLAHEADRVRALRDLLLARLAERIPGLALNGDPEERLPNTLSVRFPRVTGTALLARATDVAASTGSACHDGGEEASRAITAMGIAPADALGTVRLSLGRGTTEADVARAAAALADAWSALSRH